MTKLIKGVIKQSFNREKLQKIIHLEYNRIVEKSRLEGGGTKMFVSMCRLIKWQMLPRSKPKLLHAPNRAVPFTTSYMPTENTIDSQLY